MAGTAPDFTLPSSSFFNIYSDGPAAPPTNPTILPGGPCNFVDLTHGVNGPKCGCRRFWIRTAPSRIDATGYNATRAASSEDQGPHCMCSHHACYHDDVGTGPVTPTAMLPPPAAFAVINGNGQENERPKTNREPLTPMLAELPFQMPYDGSNGPDESRGPNGQPPDFQTFNDCSFPMDAQERQIPQDDATLVPTAGSVLEPSIPDTLNWGDFIQSQSEQGAILPPIPSQCLMPSQPSSTTSSTRQGYLRPFAGKGLQTLSSVKSKLRHAQGERLAEPTTPVRDDDRHDNGSLDPSTDDLQTVINTPGSCRQLETSQRPSQLDATAPNIRQVSSTVHDHGQRLDRLENVSFTAAGHEDCLDKHDQNDLRVTELEYRVGEVEKMLNESNSPSQHSNVNESFSTVASVSTDGDGRHINRAELYTQLQALKSQLSQLQGLSSFTSNARPWEIEVVFLPFPLKGVWLASREHASQRLSGGNNIDADPWTQLPSSVSSLDPHSPGFGEWTGPEFETDWLLARACAPDRVVDQRLRSRGLVKRVMVRGPDARSVQHAISESFGTLFRTFSRMQAHVHHGSSTHHRVGNYLGLQQPWIPLRKMHKDSRLRFLEPSEMLTPVAWDVQFLRSSVVMKGSGVSRLFITHAEAYIQDQDAYDNGWGWQRLRELSRVYPDSQSSQEVPEADAMEEYWQWKDGLDEHPSSANSSQQSFSLRQAAQPRWRSTSITSSQHRLALNLTAESSLRRAESHLSSPRLSHARMTPKMGARRASRPPHVRTTSMPPIAPSFVSPAQVPNRRVASYVHPSPQNERRPSPRVMMRPSPAAQRRRSTRSPSVLRLAMVPGRNQTPRWSTASPDPMLQHHGAGGNGGRATTPFYATPYSNAPYMDTRAMVVGGVIIDNDEDDGEYEDDGRDESSDTSDGNVEDEYDSQMADLPLGHDESSHIVKPSSHKDHNDHDDDDNDDDDDWQDAHLASLDESDDGQLPEDEPWPGIEDAENRDPMETDVEIDLGVGILGETTESSSPNIDIHIDEDAMSDIYDGTNGGASQQGQQDEAASQASSVPSEYPSTQGAWMDGDLATKPRKALGLVEAPQSRQDRQTRRSSMLSGHGFAVFEDAQDLPS